MKYINFYHHFADQVIFSLNDIRRVDPHFHRRRLSEWQEKGYITKIIRGYYMIPEKKINETTLFYAANKIYHPSYISLESALSYYQFIPETVYQTTCISSKKTALFETSIGDFRYLTVKPVLFGGYTMVRGNFMPFKIATPEKAVFDFLYLNPHYKTRNDFLELRINVNTFRKKINPRKLNDWIKQCNTRTLIKRGALFLETCSNA